MLINKIILNNYRLYEGENAISFNFDETRISIWCVVRMALAKPHSSIPCCGACMDVSLAIFLFQGKTQATILPPKRAT